MLASILPRPLLLCFVWVCSPGSHLTALLPQAAPRLSSCPFMCLQLWKANSGARKMPHMYNAAAFTDSSYPLISCHYSWPLNSSQQDCCDFELTFFPCVCVWDRDRGQGLHWSYHIRTMRKQHENLHSPQGHLTLNTSCEGCLLLHVCVWGCVSFSLSMGCDFYAAIRRDSTDH